MALPLNPPPIQVPPEFSASKQVSAFFSGLINTIYQMWTALYGIRYTATLKTTDDTVTGLIRVPIPTDRSIMIEARIAARRTGGSAGTAGDSAWYTLTGMYKNVGGTLTGIGVADLISGEDQAAWNVGFSSVGTDAVVTVIGAVGNDITWEGTVSTYVVGA